MADVLTIENGQIKRITVPSGNDTEVSFGDIAADGAWLIVQTGNDLVFQRKESGQWVEKGRMEA